jgi:hypothetical protein
MTTITTTQTTNTIRNTKDNDKDTILSSTVSNLVTSNNIPISSSSAVATNNSIINSGTTTNTNAMAFMNLSQKRSQPNNIYPSMTSQPLNSLDKENSTSQILQNNLLNRQQNSSNIVNSKNTDIDLDALYSISVIESTPPPPAPVPHRKSQQFGQEIQQQQQQQSDIQITLKDIRSSLQKTQKLPIANEISTPRENPVSPPEPSSPVWIPRLPENSRESFDSDQPSKLLSADEEEADTDLETDRLLGQQRLDDQGFYDDKNNWSDRTRIRNAVRSPLTTATAANLTKTNRSPQSQSVISNNQNQIQNNSHKSHTTITRQGVGTTLSPNKSNIISEKDELSPDRLQKSPTGSVDSNKKVSFFHDFF